MFQPEEESVKEKKILVTGGAGYVGSHTTLALLQAGMNVVILDNLCNSLQESLRRVGDLAWEHFRQSKRAMAQMFGI